MADPLSATASVVTLVVVTLQSSKLLYQTVTSFQNNNRAVRELKEELEALNVVLQSLHETLLKTDADLAALELPLRRCCRACQDFEAVIEKCTARSGGTKTSFRDWARLIYLGEDIVGFKNMLAGYKSTIAIALGDANIRKSAITLNVLNEYKTLIANTTVDLEEHLQKIDEKLHSLSHEERDKASNEDLTERHQMQEERDSAQKCLEICGDVMAHIDRVHPNNIENVATSPDSYLGYSVALDGRPSARAATVDAFQICKERLTTTTAQLEKHLQDISNRLQRNSPLPHVPSNEQTPELEGIREEMESIRQCISICTQASTKANHERVNVFEDISTTDDGHQVLVSTFGDLISAKRVTAGARSSQWLGQMSDKSLQSLSAQYDRVVAVSDVEPAAGTDSNFEGRYGVGLKLSNKSLGGGVMPSGAAKSA